MKMVGSLMHLEIVSFQNVYTKNSMPTAREHTIHTIWQFAFGIALYLLLCVVRSRFCFLSLNIQLGTIF